MSSKKVLNLAASRKASAVGPSVTTVNRTIHEACERAELLEATLQVTPPLARGAAPAGKSAPAAFLRGWRSAYCRPAGGLASIEPRPCAFGGLKISAQCAPDRHRVVLPASVLVRR
jgi:hypothetical protein